MIRLLVIASVFIFNFYQLRAQHALPVYPLERKNITVPETGRYQYVPGGRDIASNASIWFDVTYYRLYLKVSTNPPYLSGVATVGGVCRQDPETTLVLDLMNPMRVDSVKVGGLVSPFRQGSSSFEVYIGPGYGTDDELALDIYYGGIPRGTGFGSFVFGDHGGTPWVWSLSEPYGAKDWWPCKDHPSDKADSADIIITCDSSFKAGSNGKLISVIDNPGGTKTYHWRERYPIAAYLISIALTNYAQFSNWFRYTQTDSMEILNYVLPEHLSTALEELPRTVDMLKIFSELYGIYPFVNEKYGHSEFGRGGAMEHQTMTSTATFTENVIAHELAHQWFGDMITCASWSDLWLNEGFAQYSTALYLEKKYGAGEYRRYIKDQMNNARWAEGSLRLKDTSSVAVLFDGKLVYSKGASVLHMLRHLLGDTVFFRAMYNYANDAALKYGTATTEDFHRVCEKTAGVDLDFFFNEWVFGENHPRYSLTWDAYRSGAGHEVSIEIAQTPNTASPRIFTMPLDIKLSGDTWDTTVVVFNDEERQRFLFQSSHPVKSVELDPGEWVLKSVNENYLKNFGLSEVFPNPLQLAAQSTVQVGYRIPHRLQVKLSVFNLLGQEVKKLVDGVQPMGEYPITWDASSIPSGVYFYRLQADVYTGTKKLIILR